MFTMGAGLRSLEQATSFLRPSMEGLEHERLVAIHLDDQLQTVAVSTAEGDRNRCDVPFRRFFHDALNVGARAMMLAHNHPGCSPEPSCSDKQATRRIAETARSLDIALVDHLIFAGQVITSFRGLGLL